LITFKNGDFQAKILVVLEQVF